MSALLYFFPAVELKTLAPGERFSREILARYGLEGVLGDLPVSACSRNNYVAAILDGASGAMLSPNTAGQPPVRFGYYPELQTWHKVRSDPPLWIGIDREHPPGPADLARPNMVPGHPVKLADGNLYQIAVIRSPVRDTCLPRDMYRDAAGEFCMSVQQEHLDLWQRSEPLWDMIYSEASDARRMAFAEILDRSIELLGVNYRYSHAEQAALRLITSGNETWEKMFQAAVDAPLVEEVLGAEKKTGDPPQPGPPSSMPGPGECSPSTDPAGEKCSSPASGSGATPAATSTST